MARRRTQRFIVTKVTTPVNATGPDGDDGDDCADGPDGRGASASVRRMPDDVIVEEPMSIRLDGVLAATTMRTPGNDYELAAGFCFTEGLLGGARVLGVRYCADDSASLSKFNIVTVETGGRAPRPTPRLGNVSSSCGWCGTDQIEALSEQFEPLPVSHPIGFEVLAAIPGLVARSQALFDVTGAVHAAAAFDPSGDLLAVREDVGRHNAVDKIVGSMVLAQGGGLPATGLGLFVSGRASIEMVQKAWAAGFSTLVAVSAPTSMAVEAARRAGLALVGFMRDESFNVYAPDRHPDREPEGR